MFDSILFEAGMNSCEFRNCYVTLDQFYGRDHCETRIHPPFSSWRRQFCSEVARPLTPDAQSENMVPQGCAWRLMGATIRLNCVTISPVGPRPKSRPAASRAAFWGEPAAAATCSAWPPLTHSGPLTARQVASFRAN